MVGFRLLIARNQSEVIACFMQVNVYSRNMTKARRSECPIAYALDLFGDRWTLLVLRDLIFGRKRYYQEFLESPERVATNVLADRLDRLERANMVTKERDPDDGKRFVYEPTPKALDTLPIMLEMIAWSGEHDAKTPVSGAFVERIRTDRDALVAEFKERLKQRDESTSNIQLPKGEAGAEGGAKRTLGRKSARPRP